MGGMAPAIESGYVQREIQQTAYEYQKAIERGERVVVGVNRYCEKPKSDTPPRPAATSARKILRIDPAIEQGQVERLRRMRARRDSTHVQATLQAVEGAARTDRNLMPVILDAVKAYATVGEISDALRRVFGQYQESVVI